MPVLRDIFFLLIVRPFSRGTIFHYHAGGLPKYVKTSRFPVRLLANLALAKPNLGIEVSNSQLRESNYFFSERRVVIPNGLDVPVEKFKREKLEAVQKKYRKFVEIGSYPFFHACGGGVRLSRTHALVVLHGHVRKRVFDHFVRAVHGFAEGYGTRIEEEDTQGGSCIDNANHVILVYNTFHSCYGHVKIIMSIPLPLPPQPPLLFLLLLQREGVKAILIPNIPKNCTTAQVISSLGSRLNINGHTK